MHLVHQRSTSESCGVRTTHLHATRSTAPGKQSQKVLIVPFGRAPLQTNWCHDTNKVSSTILLVKTLRCPLHLLGSESSSIQAADHAHDPECPPRKKQMLSPINNLTIIFQNPSSVQTPKRTGARMHWALLGAMMP
jgi:hypothetical protein